MLYCDPKLREGLQRSGALTDGTSAEAIAAEILALVRSPERLRALSEGAKEDSVTFSGATYVERVMQAYADAGTA